MGWEGFLCLLNGLREFGFSEPVHAGSPFAFCEGDRLTIGRLRPKFPVGLREGGQSDHGIGSEDQLNVWGLTVSFSLHLSPPTSAMAS